MRSNETHWTYFFHGWGEVGHLELDVIGQARELTYWHLGEELGLASSETALARGESHLLGGQERAGVYAKLRKAADRLRMSRCLSGEHLLK